MTDFSQILDAWENRGHRKDSEPWVKDQPTVDPQSLPTRAAMELAVPEEELDLHGMLQEEAANALRFFLRESRLEGRRKVLIIHGKGLHSENRRGVLKDAVAQILNKDRNVAAWGEAGRRHGGKGASWVWLSVRGK